MKTIQWLCGGMPAMDGHWKIGRFFVYCYFEINVCALLCIYSTPPFKIHPTTMFHLLLYLIFFAVDS